MNTYRYGFKTNIMGDCWYAIEKKYLFLWIEVHTFSDRETMMDVVDQLKKHNIIYNAN